MKGKFLKFILLPFSQKLIVVESLVFSFWFEICLRFNLYRFIKDLHVNADISLQSNLDNQEIIILVRKSARAIRNYAPWKPKCYNAALVAKKLLLRRSIESSIHIGFSKKEMSNFKGHAWVTHCGKIVAGDLKSGLTKFTELEKS